MNLWFEIFTFLLLCLCLYLQHWQVNAFLHEHNTPPLPNRLRNVISLIYIPLGMFLSYKGNISALLMFSALLPLLWLDTYRHWLPLRFTNAFWCIGLLTQLLSIEHDLSLLSAVLGSTLMFGLMGTLWWGLRRYHRREVLGFGDVHLIAGLFSWLSLTTALYSCGFAFLLMLLPMAINKKPQPVAPYLCLSLLAGLLIAEFTPK
ncbi:prepilin peptidase [Salmonella enterica subsp. enterica serovar Newport]